MWQRQLPGRNEVLQRQLQPLHGSRRHVHAAGLRLHPGTPRRVTGGAVRARCRPALANREAVMRGGGKGGRGDGGRGGGLDCSPHRLEPGGIAVMRTYDGERGNYQNQWPLRHESFDCSQATPYTCILIESVLLSIPSLAVGWDSSRSSESLCLLCNCHAAMCLSPSSEPSRLFALLLGRLEFLWQFEAPLSNGNKANMI